MPLLRYFVFVGGTLLALLFVSDAVLPKQPLPSFLNVASSDLPRMRIHSERKWPERIVFDTSVPTVKPAMVAEAQPAAAPTAEIAAVAPKARVREAFAQLMPPASAGEAKSEYKGDSGTGQAPAKAAEARPQAKRKVAKARPSRPLMLVAQQPHFGLFGSTW